MQQCLRLYVPGRHPGGLRGRTLALDASSVGGPHQFSPIARATVLIGAGSRSIRNVLTMNQPANTLLASALNWERHLYEAGEQHFTVVATARAVFTGTNLVLTGTLRPASAGALGGTNATAVVDRRRHVGL